MKPRLIVLTFFLRFATSLWSQTPETGAVSGSVFDRVNDRDADSIAVTVQTKADGKIVRSGATDARGAFHFKALPVGEYQLNYHAAGAPRSVSFSIDAQHRTVDLGRLELEGGAAMTLEKFEVSTRQEAFYNTIDRKVYNVGKDVQSATGSASDLLQNVPSVQVDIEGNVSLRGDGNVLILINGKPSTMMGRNRAAVLEQMPADGIEKIEVITNPSAKYKPDGTGGIINITMKKKQISGYSGSARAAVGNNRRYNASLSGNYNPGNYNLYGSASVRQDDRARSVQDERSHPDSPTGASTTKQVTSDHSRPLSRIVQTGIDYHVDEQTKIGAAVSYNYRDVLRQATVSTLTTTGGIVTQDYDRVRTAPEYEKDLEFTGTLQHAFPGKDQELNLEIRHGKTTEQEDSHYTKIDRSGGTGPLFENTFNRDIETGTETTVEYIHPIDDVSKFEAGYDGEWSKVDLDLRGSAFNPVTQLWQLDRSKTNRFLYEETTHAVFTTYARKISRFGFLAGLRFEQALIRTHQVTARLLDKTDYHHLYPSLHLSYDLAEGHQLQLNYSHRVNRPDGDDLNPFPHYDDPTNVSAGNPRLRPEKIHSIETGYQFQNNDTTYLATLYYRYRYNGVTEIRRFVDSVTLLPSPSGTVLLTTAENLGVSRSGGLELGASTRLQDRLSLNFSANAYRNEINARSLGFSSKRSTIAWDAKLNATFDLTKSTLLQLNTHYTAKRLTPQGYRYPTYVANIGLRHNFKDKKTAFIFSVSDIFNSLKERSLTDTPSLHQEITRRRGSRIIFAGFTYSFGKTSKKDDLQFDNSL